MGRLDLPDPVRDEDRDPPVEVTARQELEEIADKLREADEKEKAGKKAKEKIRPAFFDLITEVVEEEMPLAQEVLTLNTEFLPLPELPLEARLVAYQRKHYPMYVVTQWKLVEDGHVEVLLIEDPKLMKFQFTAGGYKFGRTSYLDGGGLDVEKLADTLDTEVVDLSDEAFDALDRAIQEKKVYEVDDGLMQDALTEYPELVDFIREFIDPGTPKVKLLPISKAKEE